MTNRLEGKNVVITGASAGFGEACAHAFASRGANLELWARRGDRLERLKAEVEGRHRAAVCVRALDVRDREAVKQAAVELRAREWAPDVLVNNAGLASGFEPIQEGRYEDWDVMIDTNIKGLLNVSREMLPMMVERDRGHVINIGSVAGYMVYPKGNVYSATKFAVRALTEGMNIDLFGTRIRVSSVDPGAAETEFSAVRFHGDDARAKKVYEGFEPLSAADVADAVVYVANTPPHVNIARLVVMPTAQRNPYLIHRTP
jgi:NADP-dependent 3-hydroxy acid dehydrogenase YdfG